MMKKSLILLSLLMLVPSAFAGGSIFGGHKSRTSNPDGVSSIGIHICGSLNCPEVILKSGDCGTVEHATTKYGVCVCDDGYYVEDGVCFPMDPSEITDKTTCLSHHYKWFESWSGEWKLCLEDIPEENCTAPEYQWYVYKGEGYCLKNLNTEKDSCLNAGHYWLTIYGDGVKERKEICTDTGMKEHVFCELNNGGNGNFGCGPGINHYTGEELISDKDCFCGEA